MKKETNIEAFLTLVRAGLWELDVRLSNYGQINYPALLELAEEQSVVGLIAAGLEHVEDVKIPKQDLLLIIGETLQLEERNKAMNYFIGVLVEKMREMGIHTLLVKGQGVAQCYERPLWRSSGDIDLFLDSENYEKAKKCLSHYGIIDSEDKKRLHLGITIDNWLVELHGTMHTDISPKLDVVIDEVQRDIFQSRGFRSWNNSGINVLLPNPDNDVIIVFTHFINHFYVGGIGLRQICDWCRLLWIYKEQIDSKLLESRLKKMGLVSEWKAFSAFAVDYLDMPQKAMPLYVESKKWQRKAASLRKLIIQAGNLGINNERYRIGQSKTISKMTVFRKRLKEFSRLVLLFPRNATVFFCTYLFNRLKNSR